MAAIDAFSVFTATNPILNEQKTPPPDNPPLVSQEFALLFQEIATMKEFNCQLIKFLENEFAKSQSPSRKIIHEFQREMMAASDTIYQISSEGQRNQEKRDRREKRNSLILCATCLALIIVNIIVPGIGWIIERL